ncbi:acyl-CoA thioesterase [Mucilaginibacter psychrotolerans]|uniref:Acyl-CoA thioesterase n=1 Tax=Mucilaginibacter psychrotolerans TaxID=1524096 RepID=A0A4Y8S6V0_9SPHI|nr:acyl-CoA thioesterase [Mucilaginibacter psychrotolerans]TFF34749.1 acyl-CoA thioesterase [Mucilaginibacter psychrotolerans]
MEAYKTVAESQTTLTELMIPSYANFGGKIHGGIIMGLMDKVAYVCSAKHAGAYCVTASVEDIYFLAPVEVGELVSLMASVNYVGRTSLVVGIRVVSENVKTHQIKHTNTSYFTMVAMDEQHQPLQVPGLVLHTDVEIRRFFQGLHRKQLKKYYRQEEDRVKSDFEMTETIELLKGERCRIEKG